MAGKKKVDEDVNLVDETSTTVSEDSEGTSGMEGYSKSNLLSIAMHQLAGSTPDQIAFFLKSLESQSGDGVPDDAHAKNKASIAAKGAIAEDLANIFGEDETLTEEFKTKLTTIFESVVDMRVDEIRVELEEQYNQDVEKSLVAITEELKVELDQFLDYIASEYIKENEVAIDKSLKADIAENVLVGLKSLFDENFITIPEEKVDIADALSEEVESLQEQLNTLIQTNIELGDKLKQFAKQDAIAEHIVGMTDVQADKFIKLVENIEFSGDVEAFNKKLGVIKESNFVKADKPAKTNIVIDESISEAAPKAKDTKVIAESDDEDVRAVQRALKRFGKR